MKASFYTLGCKVNQNETGALEQMFRQAGFDIAGKEETADIYIVNSCTVTAGGDAKSRQWLRRAKRENPQAVAVLTGCFPQAFPEQALMPEADVVTGTAARSKLIQHVQQFLQTGKRVVDITPHQEKEEYEELPKGRMQGRTRAFIKIEDGCNRRCAYCIVPTARGPVRSRSVNSILQEVEELAATGCAEIVLTGVNLPSYGQDTGTDLAGVVEEIAAIEGIKRIRLSSLDPDLVTQAQIERFAKVDKLCPHFHLSLQSGCDATLKRMRRPYRVAQYREAAKALRQAIPQTSLTTDVIVGFPGETEQEFAESMAFVKEMEFLKVHVFPFSPRPGTMAAEMPNQLAKQQKTERVALMQKAADSVRARLIGAARGLAAEVLLEKPAQEGLYTGYTENYIPVLVPSSNHNTGEIVPVRLDMFDGERCTATVIDN